MYDRIVILVFIIPLSFQINEKALQDHLLADYSRFVRPVRNGSKPVVVKFGFELVHILSVSEADQTITSKVWFRLSWVNEYMRWDPTKFGNVTSTRLDNENVWTPDIYLLEDVSSEISSGPAKYKTQVIMYPSGSQFWMVPAILASSCTFDVKHFPFDHQRFKLVFTSWSHDQKELDIKHDERAVITGNYVNSTAWRLHKVDVEVHSKLYACCANPYVDITYYLTIHRKPLYYFFNIVAPCIIQMLIILFTFFLPPDSGERIGVVITVLLVFAVYLEVVSKSLPKTSTSTPALSMFYLVSMSETAFSLLATCIVLIIHFKGAEKGIGPMPTWARRFLDSTAEFFCVSRNIREHTDDELLALQDTYMGVNASNANHVEAPHNEIKQDLYNASDVSMSTLVEEVRVVTSLIHDQNLQDEIEEEWQVLAKVIDRIFFFVFLFMFVVSSLAILLPIYVSHVLDDGEATW